MENDTRRQMRFVLPPPIGKGNRGRTILIPRRVILRLQDYIEIERASAIAKFKARSVWTRITQPIFVERSEGNTVMLTLSDGSSARFDRFDPEERQRLVFCKARVPDTPAALWLSEIGLPVRFNSWEAIFLRVSGRCSNAGLDIRLSPHQLRHAFTVHMLAMLIEQQIGHAEHDVSGMEA